MSHLADSVVLRNYRYSGDKGKTPSLDDCDEAQTLAKRPTYLDNGLVRNNVLKSDA